MVKRSISRISTTGGGSIATTTGGGGGTGSGIGSITGSQRGGGSTNQATTTITTCGKCCYYFRQVITFLFSHIGLCTLLLGYALVGAFTFQALESVHEKEQRIEMRKSRDRLIQRLSNLTNESIILRFELWTRKAEDILLEFEKEFLHAVKYKGYDGYEELSKTNSQWSFSGALLYSIIVITTIGYGNVAPRTEWGKIVTILYAIIGIPLMLFCLSNIGHMMARSFKFIYWKCCCYLCVKPKKQRRKQRQRQRQRRQRRQRRRQRQLRKQRQLRRAKQQQQQQAAIHATVMAMNPLLLSNGPQSQQQQQPLQQQRISRSQSSQRSDGRHNEKWSIPVPQEKSPSSLLTASVADNNSSSPNTLQLPRRMILSRSLSARYHNELRASKLRAINRSSAQSTKIVPVRKTTVNMPPVICNQYASFSDERLDRAVFAANNSIVVKRPTVFRSSSMADNGAGTRSRQQQLLNAQVRFGNGQTKQRPSSLQPPQSSSAIRQSASSSNLMTNNTNAATLMNQPQRSLQQQRSIPSSDMMMLMEMNHNHHQNHHHHHMTTFQSRNHLYNCTQSRPFVPINISDLSDDGSRDFDSNLDSDLDFNDDDDDNDNDNDDDDDGEEIQEKNIPITVCLALVISYICGGAWFFSTSEEWSFLDASYFCFITLSTIGFGDLVPGRTVLSTHEDGQMTLAICALYLLFGMALLAMSLNLVKEKVLETVRIVGERIGILVSDDDDDDDDEDEDNDDDDDDNDQNNSNIYNSELELP